jgi:hypothetical protein
LIFFNGQDLTSNLSVKVSYHPTGSLIDYLVDKSRSGEPEEYFKIFFIPDFLVLVSHWIMACPPRKAHCNQKIISATFGFFWQFRVWQASAPRGRLE